MHGMRERIFVLAQRAVREVRRERAIELLKRHKGLPQARKTRRRIGVGVKRRCPGNGSPRLCIIFLRVENTENASVPAVPMNNRDFGSGSCTDIEYSIDCAQCENICWGFHMPHC